MVPLTIFGSFGQILSPAPCLADRSVEGAIQVVDSTTPVVRAFVRFGGPQAHDHSLVGCLKSPTRNISKCGKVCGIRQSPLPTLRQHRRLRSHSVRIVSKQPLKRRPLPNRSVNQIRPFRIRPRIHIRLHRQPQLLRCLRELTQYRLTPNHNNVLIIGDRPHRSFTLKIPANGLACRIARMYSLSCSISPSISSTGPFNISAHASK